MKAFVTGATGFIGSHFVHQMARRGHELRCLIRSSSSIGLLDDISVKYVTGDVTDRRCLLQGMNGVDWVINLANLYSFWEPDRSVFARVNIDGTRNVMECALEAGVSKVVHVSTAGIWGNVARTPVTEDTMVGQVRVSDYFKTKYEGDLIAWELYKTRGLPLVMIYPTAVLGPGDPKATGQYVSRLVNGRMPARVYEDTMFTFVHVRDVAEAIVRAVEKPGNLGEKYIIGKYRLTFGEINRMVGEISGVPLPRLKMPNFLVMPNAFLLTALAGLTKKPPLFGMAVDQMRVMRTGFAMDGTKAERELGLSYTSIRTTLEETVAALRK